MGTYNASKIRNARKATECVYGCEIQIGEAYLSYAPGLRSREPVCLAHAFSVTFLHGGGLRYRCYDIEQALEQRADVAAA